jgi:COP9 signalosome complex subunit 4
MILYFGSNNQNTAQKNLSKNKASTRHNKHQPATSNKTRQQDSKTMTMEETIVAIDEAIAKNDCQAIISIFNIQWNQLGTGEQRSVASHFIQQAVVVQDDDGSSFLSRTSIPLLLDTYTTALQHLPATVEQAADTILRRTLFHYLVDDVCDYGTAARLLAGTRIQESGVYVMTSSDAADLFVSVAECFLQQDEISEADAAVTKAGHYIAEATTSNNNNSDNSATNTTNPVATVSMALLLRYKTTNARVLDANRKFSAAARSYHELSLHDNVEEQLPLLARAVTCAILDNSNQRYKVLASLMAGNDDRVLNDTLSVALPEYTRHAEMAILMHQRQIVSPLHVLAVEATLADHQRVVTTTHHLTILQRSVVQHNLMAVSQLYESIHLHQLASILNMVDHQSNNKNNKSSVKMAEQITARMIQEKGMAATIDAVDGIVDFFPTNNSTSSNGNNTDPSSAVATTTTSTTTTTDQADVAWCRQLNATVQAIQAEQQRNQQQQQAQQQSLPTLPTLPTLPLPEDSVV